MAAPPLNVDSPPLAVTGVNSQTLAMVAIAMMGVGGMFVIGSRRERDE